MNRPTHQVRPRSSWKTLWKGGCIGSLCMAVILVVSGKLVALLARNSTDTSWFLNLDGLLALGELVSWTMAGIGGIGWIVSRRTPTVDDPGVRSGLDA
jgi:hypothetical protein